MSLKVQTKINLFPVIYAAGEVDMGNCIEIHDALTEQLGKGNFRIILNLKKINFIDSACLGMLLRTLDKAKEKEGTIVLVGNPFIDRILTVTGLTHLFEVFRREEEAINYLLAGQKSA